MSNSYDAEKSNGKFGYDYQRSKLRLIFIPDDMLCFRSFYYFGSLKLSWWCLSAFCHSLVYYFGSRTFGASHLLLD